MKIQNMPIPITCPCGAAHLIEHTGGRDGEGSESGGGESGGGESGGGESGDGEEGGGTKTEAANSPVTVVQHM